MPRIYRVPIVAHVRMPRPRSLPKHDEPHPDTARVFTADEARERAAERLARWRARNG